MTPENTAQLGHATRRFNSRERGAAREVRRSPRALAADRAQPAVIRLRKAGGRELTFCRRLA